MAAPLRKQSLSIKDRLFQEPYTFSFSQAVMLLEILNQDRDPVASTPRADREAVRLTSNILLSTPPSDIYALTTSHSPLRPSQLTINFMGVAGQTGPLPHVYGEMILERVKRKDYAFRDFLDIFNNRLAGINYRIRVKHNLGLNRKHLLQTDVAQILECLGGAPDPLTVEAQIPKRSFLKYTGLMFQKPRTAIGLEVMLKDYFKLPFRVEQFQGFWSHLDEDQVTRIGPRLSRKYGSMKTPPGFGQQNRLGETAALGTKAWVHNERVSVTVEGLKLDDYLGLLPDQMLNKTVSEMTRQFMGRNNYFTFTIGLGINQATPTRLDGRSALGWTSWLKETPIDYIPVSIRVRSNDPIQ